MNSMPRILPLVGVAIGGVLAINALAGARDLPNLISGARAFAEEAVKDAKAPKKDSKAKPSDSAKAADSGEAKDAAAALPASPLPPPTVKPQAICAPTAAELAKEAGLSPAELQVLQHLGARRGELEQRETDLDTQLALLAAAEAKLDAKAKALTGLKADVQSLLNQADGREAAEIDRLVKVFSGMKPKEAAPRMVLLDDSVRLPIAAKMNERILSAIVAQMTPADAKKLTEALAKRFVAARNLASIGVAQADQAQSAPAPAAEDKGAASKPAKKPPARKRAPAAKQAVKKASPEGASEAPADAQKAG